MVSNALQLACLYGSHDTVKLLLERGWGLQVESKTSLLGLTIHGLRRCGCLWSPSLAIGDRSIETAKLLLSYGVNPNEISEFNEGFNTFPIFKAIGVGSAELVKVLLDFGASADVEDYRGLKTFHVAAIDGKNEIADLLLAASTDANDFARTVCRAVALVHQALRSHDKTGLLAALDKWPRDARGSKYLSRALRTATRNNNYNSANCLKALLDKGAILDSADLLSMKRRLDLFLNAVAST